MHRWFRVTVLFVTMTATVVEAFRLQSPNGAGDPLPVDQTYSGTILRWSDHHIGYYINDYGSGLPVADVISAAQQAFQSWGSSGAEITFVYMGLTNAQHDPFDGKNVIFWDTTGVYVGAGGLGHSLSTYNSATGVISDVDIALNGSGLSSSVAIADPSCQTLGTSFAGGAYHVGGIPLRWMIGSQGITGPFFNATYLADLQSTLIHEVGHLLGLHHSPVVGATMSTVFQTPRFFCSTDQASIEADDISGVRFLYPPANQPPTAGFSMRVGSQSVSSPGTLNAVADASTNEADVHFDDASTDPDGGSDIVSRTWVTDTGVTLSQDLTSFRYGFNPGVYRVTLTVRDRAGATSSAVGTLAIARPANATDSFTDPSVFLSAVGNHTTITFDDMPTGFGIADGASPGGIRYNFYAAGRSGIITNAFLAVSPPNTLGIDRQGAADQNFFFPGESVTLTFPPTTAVGAYFTSNVNAGTAQGFISISTPAGVAWSGDALPAGTFGFPANTLRFVGLTSATPFTQATFTITNPSPGNVGFALDNVILGTGSPTPAPSISGVSPSPLVGNNTDRPADIAGSNFFCPNASDPAQCVSIEAWSAGVLVGTLHAPGQIQNVTASSSHMLIKLAPGPYSLVAVNPDGGRSTPFDVTAAALPPAPPDGATELDQENVACLVPCNSGPAVVGVTAVAQTFTVGTSGTLSRIEIGLYRSPGTLVDVVLDILPAGTLATFNLGASLFRTTIPVGNLPECSPQTICSTALVSVDLPPGGLTVSAGDQLAIVLTRPAGQGAPPWVIWQLTGPVYGLGAAFVSYPFGTPWRLEPAITDLRFRTWIVR